MHSSNQKQNVLHVINGLGLGGTETMLYNLIRYQNPTLNYRSRVVHFGAGHHFVATLKELGVEVFELNIRKSPLSALFHFLRLAQKSDTVCSWSYHSHLLSMVSRLLFRHRLVWAIRHQDTSRSTNKFLTWLIMRICAKLSRFSNVITFNGAAAQKSHLELGFSKHNQVVLPNGCDTDAFSPLERDSSYIPSLVSRDLGGVSIVLSAARWHPIKDHATFIEAFAELNRRSPKQAIAVLCGSKIDRANAELLQLLSDHELEIDKEVFLLGPRDDLAKLMASCSLYVLHSKSEAFPNTLIQAMAAGARVVSTDVGIVSEITNGAVYPVEASDPQGLANQMYSQLNQKDIQRDPLGRDLRQIVLEEYSITSIIPLYEEAILG